MVLCAYRPEPQPAADSQHQSPIAPLTLFFNHAGIDLDRVQITLSQSVHGPDYDLTNQHGAGFTELPEPQRTAKQLLPVGTGRVEGRQIHSIGPVAFTSLDYIAYAVVPVNAYPVLWAWEQGEIQSLAQLQNRLLEALK